jgi:hypothetical protein
MSTSNPTVLSVWRHSWWRSWQLQYNILDMCIQVTITNKPNALQLNMLSPFTWRARPVLPTKHVPPIFLSVWLCYEAMSGQPTCWLLITMSQGSFLTTNVRFRNSCTQPCCLLHARIIARNSVYRISCWCPSQQLNTVRIAYLEEDSWHTNFSCLCIMRTVCV